MSRKTLGITQFSLSLSVYIFSYKKITEVDYRFILSVIFLNVYYKGNVTFIFSSKGMVRLLFYFYLSFYLRKSL